MSWVQSAETLTLKSGDYGQGLDAMGFKEGSTKDEGFAATSRKL